MKAAYSLFKVPVHHGGPSSKFNDSSETCRGKALGPESAGWHPLVSYLLLPDSCQIPTRVLSEYCQSPYQSPFRVRSGYSYTTPTRFLLGPTQFQKETYKCPTKTSPVYYQILITLLLILPVSYEVPARFYYIPKKIVQ